MTIRIAHESPVELFYYVQSKTDYDYCLVHLLEENENYKELFTQACKEREVILDNSIFELGEAFDMKKFFGWVDELNPTWYIIPDALEDSKKTVYNAYVWNQFYRPGRKQKSIAVVQGENYEEIVECYQVLDGKLDVDMIAISFDYSFYEKLVPHPNRLVSWMLGRVTLLGMLERDGIINKQKPHHLLGNALYWEGVFYKDYDWIYSIDTSNPVVFAINNLAYNNTYTFAKPTQKLHTLINTPADQINIHLLKNNIEEFRAAWNR
jgi:hypothetical protein